MDNQNRIKVEVVFALKDRQEIITIHLPKLSTISDAIEESNKDFVSVMSE